VASFVKMIRTPEDASVMGPVIKDFLDLNVKNDEHIVRLVQIAQRLVGVSSKNADTGMLTEEEKSQLLKNIKSDFESVLAEQDDLDITVSGMKK
jgi:indole-3-glycerol phosphate synthase